MQNLDYALCFELILLALVVCVVVCVVIFRPNARRYEPITTLRSGSPESIHRLLRSSGWRPGQIISGALIVCHDASPEGEVWTHSAPNQTPPALPCFTYQWGIHEEVNGHPRPIT